MKLRITFFTILWLVVAVLPASADNNIGCQLPQCGEGAYDNGPINGTTDAWTINFGYVVSNTFTGVSYVDFIQLGVWEFPGDTTLSLDWSITSGENSPCPSGECLGNGTASGRSLTDTYISTNQYGYNIDTLGALIPGVQLSPGVTYWLNLQNAAVSSGDPVYWDENSGVMCGGTGGGANCPAKASESAVGTISSEAFTINGAPGVPEPSSSLLFGSGILGLAGVLRRKLTF